MAGLTIGKLAARTGVNVETIRYGECHAAAIVWWDAVPAGTAFWGDRAFGRGKSDGRCWQHRC